MGYEPFNYMPNQPTDAVLDINQPSQFLPNANGTGITLPNNTNIGMPTADASGGGFLGMGKDTWGNIGTGLQAAGGLAQLWLGMKNYGLMKAQLGENKRQYNQNYAAQRLTTNSSLRDRQSARVASGDGYQSVGAYMSQNGIA